MKDRGFVSAEALWIGAELIDKNVVLVEQLYRQNLGDESEKIYNFKVNDFHTYFVSELSILVHNAEYSPEMKQKIQERQKAGHEYEKEQHEQLKKINSTAEDQVRVKPIDENGKFRINEYKLGPDSPYQKNQIANGFPEGSTNRDIMIVSGDHEGEILPKGTPVTTYRKEERRYNMAITEKDVVDSVAYEDDFLLLQLYDHLDFEGEFEKDHMMMLQDKLNTYIWYIDSKQYRETYPGKKFNNFLIKIFFVFEPSVLCKDFIIHVNKRLSNTKIKIEYIVESDESKGGKNARRI